MINQSQLVRDLDSLDSIQNLSKLDKTTSQPGTKRSKKVLKSKSIVEERDDSYSEKIDYEDERP